MKKITTIIIVFFVSANAFSQFNGKAVHGGDAGIYVYNSFAPCSQKLPNKDGAVKVKVERKKAGGNWENAGVMDAPANETDLANRYRSAYRFVLAPEFAQPDNILAIWAKYKKYQRWDSLQIFLYDRIAALAMGYEFIDTTADKNAPYEYQLSEIDRSGSVIKTTAAGSGFFPDKTNFVERPHLDSVEQRQNEIFIEWKMNAVKTPRMFKVYRKTGVLGDYEFLKNDLLIIRDKTGDPITFRMRDHAIGANQAYSYFIVAYDAYANYSEHSDTVYTKTYSTKDVLTPQFFITSSNSKEKAIELKWKLVNAQSAAAIEIYRSQTYEGTYEKIDVVTDLDTNFLDYSAKPAQVYYYYLQIIDRFQKSSFRSMRAYGLLEDLEPPVPPRYLNVVREGEKTKLTWVTSEKNIDGYYVYRAVGMDTNYVLVSGLLPAKDSLTVFFDESKNLNSAYGYSYAVKQENTSHVASNFSVPSFIESNMSAENIPGVMGLTSQMVNGKAMLYWESLQNVQGVVGYTVLRRITGESTFKKTAPFIPASNNHFTDTSLVKGNIYEYAVQSIVASGKNSAASASATVDYSFSNPNAPGISLAQNEGTVEISWSSVDKGNVKEFRIYRGERGAEPQKISTATATDQTYSDKTATKNKSYFYYITAVGIDGTESEKSDVKLITVQ